MHDIQTLAEDSWRLFPHTFAGRASHGDFRVNPFSRYLLTTLSDRVHTGRGRLIINVPPQHGKTTNLKWFSAWHLNRWPTRNVIQTTYAADFATDLGRNIRDIINNYPDFRIQLRTDSKSAQRFSTRSGGTLFSQGVGGAITGRGGHFMVLDDPYKDWEEAHSETYQRKLQDWFNSVFYTRQQRNTTMVIVHTRWRVGDLTDYLITEHGDDWEVIKLPAIAGDDDPLGRAPGEALAPDRYNEEELDAIKNATTKSIWSALYQQEPVPDGGTMFDRANFIVVSPGEVPRMRDMQLVRYWDMAATDDKGIITQPYSCGVLMGREYTTGRIFVLDVVRARKNEKVMRRMVKSTATRDGVGVKIYMEQEPGSAGKAVVGYYKDNVLPGFMFEGDKPTGKKAIRAQPFANHVEIGRVHIVKADWNKAYLDEHETFPGGAVKDQVDASSGAYNVILGKRKSIAQMLGEHARAARAGNYSDRIDDDDD